MNFDKLAEIAGWEKKTADEINKRKSKFKVDLEYWGWVINGQFWLHKGKSVYFNYPYTTDKLLSPEYKWIAEQTVRDVLGDESFEKRMKFYYTLMGCGNYPSAEDDLIATIGRCETLFNATPEQIYQALLKVGG